MTSHEHFLNFNDFLGQADELVAGIEKVVSLLNSDKSLKTLMTCDEFKRTLDSLVSYDNAIKGAEEELQWFYDNFFPKDTKGTKDDPGSTLTRKFKERQSIYTALTQKLMLCQKSL